MTFFFYIIGNLALLLTTFAFIPQVYKTIKTKSTRDLSLIAFSMLFAGTVLGFTYSCWIRDTPFMISNGITAVLSGMILCMKIISPKKGRK